MRVEAGPGGNTYKSRDTKAWQHHQKQEEGKRVLPYSLQREHRLADTLILNFGLQNWERLNFFYLSHSLCATLSRQPRTRMHQLREARFCAWPSGPPTYQQRGVVTGNVGPHAGMVGKGETT